MKKQQGLTASWGMFDGHVLELQDVLVRQQLQEFDLTKRGDGELSEQSGQRRGKASGGRENITA
jgi:hypothetical protein